MSKIKILYIEDDHKQRLEFQRRLRQKGFKVTSKASGQKGQSAFESNRPDVVLCDLNMPGFGGLDVLSELRRIDADVPMILLTAHGTTDEAVQAIKEGAYDFVLKPLEINKIDTTIQKALETKQLQKDLKRTESRLNILLENVPDIVYSLDPKGVFLSVNPAAEATLGFTPEEMVGNSVFDYIDTEDVERVKTGFTQAMSNGGRSSKTIEFRMVTKSGEVKYFEVNRRLVFENGKVVRQDGIARDISERKRLAKELQRYSHDLENLVKERTEKLAYASRQLAALNAVSNRFTRIYDEDEFLEEVPELLTHTLDFDRAMLLLEDNGELVFRSYCLEKDPPELVENFLKRVQDKSFTRPPHFVESFKENKTIFIPDLNSDPRWPREPGQIIRTKAVVVTPIKIGKKPVGIIIGNMQHHDREMDRQDVARFEMYANMVGLALDNIRAYKTLERKVIERTKSLKTANKELRKKARQQEKSAYSVGRANVQLLSAQEELERKNAEMARVLEELSESEQKFRQLTENIHEVFWMVDLKSKKTIYVSPSYETIFGRSRDKLYKDPDDWLIAVHREDRNRLAANLEEPTTRENEQEFRIVRPDKSVRWIRSRAFPIENQDGEVYRVCGVSEDITMRKEAEKKLKLYKEIFINSNDPINILDPHGRFIEHNPAFQELVGFSDKELEGTTPAVFSDDGAHKKISESLMETGDFRGEITVQAKSGTRVDVELSAFTIHAEDGEVQYRVGFARDITERKQAEEKMTIRLRYEEGLAACSRSLLDAHDDRGVLKDAIMHLLVAADAGRVYIFENFTDPKDGLCTRQTYEFRAPGIGPSKGNPSLLHSPYKNGFRRWQKILARGKPVKGITAKLPKRERELLQSQGVCSILALPISVDGAWYGYIGFDDVKTAREWSDEDIRLLQTAAEMIGSHMEHMGAEDALQESEERFRNLVENANDIIYSLTPEGRFTYVSPNWTDFLGHEISEVLGQPAERFVCPEDRGAFRELFRKIVETGEKQSGKEYRVKHKDGSWRWHASSASPLRDEAGQVLSIIGIAHDITERRKFIDDLERANREIRETQAQLVQSEKMASLGMLVAGIAHEINTPIGAVHSMHDTLKRAVEKLQERLKTEFPKDFEENPDLTRLMKVIDDANKVIESGSERVIKIVRRLRSFARLDEAELKAVDIHEGLEDTITLIHHEIKRTITLTRNYGELPPIACFPGRLNQVFLNLLVNAKQSIEDKGEITITTFIEDQKVHIEIRDTGKGIPKESLKKIFDPGFTTKGVGVGTGLGLSIVYRIIEDHHGSITVESTVGKGTKFSIMLPMDLERRIANFVTEPKGRGGLT